MKVGLLKIALYKIFGLPVVAYGGILTLILLLSAGYIGSMILKGKTNFSVRWHVNLARIALAMAIFHGLVGVLMFI